MKTIQFSPMKNAVNLCQCENDRWCNCDSPTAIAMGYIKIPDKNVL